MWYNFIPFLVTTTMDSKLVLFVMCLSLASADNNFFASQIYTQLAGSQCGNFLVSPWNAEIILDMAEHATTNATSQQLARVLHLTGPTKLYKIDGIEDYNRMYSTDAPDNSATTTTLNQWIESHTKGKITHLFSPSDLNDFNRAVFVSALDFKANWSEHFTNSEGIFYTPNRDFEKMDIMLLTSKLNYYASAELKAQFLELPFNGGDVTFTVVLPDEISGLGELEKKIEEVLKTPPYSQEVVRLSLPKFRVESRFILDKALKELGVTKIYVSAEGEENLIVDRVLQKSFLQLNEGGVEGAAANFVSYVRKRIWFVAGILPTTIGTKKVIDKNFVADHAFIFYIKVNDNIVFIGRVVDPIF